MAVGMTNYFIHEGMIDPYNVVAIDSTLLKQALA